MIFNGILINKSRDVIVRKVVFGMAKNPSSRLGQKLFKHNGFLLNERAILIARFSIVVINYWFIFLGSETDPALNQFTHLPAPLFFLVYGLTISFGPKFLSYRKINIILSFPEIFLVTFGLYFFPGRLPLEGFLIYLVGITVNILYGGYVSSMLLTLLVNLCYIFAVFHHFKTEHYQHFYLLLINFNLVALLVGIIGWKIKKMLETIQFEKEESKKQLFRLQTLSRITKEITSELELDKLLNLIVKKTGDLIKMNAGGIITLENDHTYRIKAIKGVPKNYHGREVKFGAGLLGQALNERKVTFLKINAAILDSASNLDEQYNFLIVSPILSKGELLGLIFLLSDSQKSPLEKDDKLILETMSEFAAIGMVNANLFKKTATLSVNDFLTGVGNLRYFYQQLEHCMAVAERYQQSCSLMMVDSDCFREIKHTYGNAQGFAHIKYLAEILKKCVRSSDFIARYDRDTFVVILPQTTLEEAIVLGERIKNQVINNPNNIDGQLITTTVSIGIASYPAQAKNVKTLMNAVESALQRASELGNNQLIAASRLDNTTD